MPSGLPGEKQTNREKTESSGGGHRNACLGIAVEAVYSSMRAELHYAILLYRLSLLTNKQNSIIFYKISIFYILRNACYFNLFEVGTYV